MIGGLLLLFQFSTALNLFSPSLVLTPIIDDFGISRGEAGFLLGLVIIAQAVFSLPGSYLAVRFGLKKVFGLGWLMCGVAVLAPLADSFGAMLGLRVALGLGTAILITAVGPLVMQWFRPRELAVMYGAMLVTFTLGVTLSLFATAPLAEALDWQRALGLEGGVLLIGAVLWIFFGKATGDVEKFETRLSLGGMRRVLFEKNTLLLVLALIGPTAFYVGFTSWLPTYYHQELGMSLTKAGFIIGLLPFAGIFGVLIGSSIPVMFGMRRPFLVIGGLATCLFGFGSFLPGDGFLLYISVVGIGLGFYMYLPSVLTMPMELPGTSPARVALMLGMMNAITGVFSFSSPLAIGALTDAFDTYIPGFTIWALFSLVVVVAGLALPETGRQLVRSRATATAAD